jgi:hypothetical protein
MKAIVRCDTGKVKHWYGTIENGEARKVSPIECASTVEIVESDGAFYLLRRNAKGECLTDTWHQTKEEAMRQAELEFDVRSEDWKSSEESE